ncbi:hypothetical protein [Silvibacterium dinghuense]|uniref:Uncharacterized protein n=1 Tax=Silvibacterium dinghuense TaxID=1560006 RepID=A0A4Q1SJV6_9BACT|nr:hypothetical protein [Silvibacterium dinghuense]RXS97946.1 hypothetical protein ESZ00_08860 [Silvibacterium dinghuense]GGH03245.1 hypothetical protein GCM10011586_18960 [Silvibacterium dinghuense]
MIFLGPLMAAAQTQPQNSNPLPDAPVPPHASAPELTYAQSKWYGVVDPGRPYHPLRPSEKMVFWLHEEVSPVSLVPAFFSAGYGQLTGGDPKFGTDSGAFGERLGAAALRESSMRFFSDSLIPTLTHTDPRYFRMGSGRPGKRAEWAVERLVIDQDDKGNRIPNYSDLGGRLAASALAMTYYPSASVNAGVVFKTWGTSLAGAAANNLFMEFWPDIRDAAFHHNRKSRHWQRAHPGQD